MKIFITGGCGFIGSHIAEFHLNKGDEVFVVDNLTTGSLKNIESFKNNSKFKCEIEDILTWKDLKKTVEWADRIYHFAAVVGVFKVLADRINVIRNNVLATEHLFRTIANSQARPLVIFAASSSAYGNNPKPMLNENDDLIVKPPFHPLATYAITKIAGESIALAYHESAKIPVILTRLFNTIGPRQTGYYGMVVPRFVHQALHNEPLTVFGDGTQTRSFCDVRDSVVAFDLLAKNPACIGQVINVGNDHDIHINDLAKLIDKCTGKKNRVQHIPYAEAYGLEYTDIAQRRPDISKMLKLIPFKHQWTLEQTIQDLVDNS